MGGREGGDIPFDTGVVTAVADAAASRYSPEGTIWVGVKSGIFDSVEGTVVGVSTK